MHPGTESGPHAPACGARRRDGQPCRNAPMLGGERCRMHGGAAAQVRAAAGRRLAAAEWARSFGAPASDADPTQTVLDEIRWAAGHVAWLRERVQETEPDALVWGVDSEVIRGSGPLPGVDVTRVAKANAWVQMYGAERDRLTRMCEVAHRMGIADRHVELAERVGSLMADLLRGVLGELGLTDEQQQRAAVAVPQHLRALVGGLNGGTAS
ncbi:HGGxSTG domain-containing protein [Streptomyces syringium]|uniref:HGGxSTG domain-containing protein n=1 Tax=Streptomyces syringium TaxID=76729 RepID=UPI0036E8BA63